MPKILYVSNTANFSKFNKPFMRWCKEQGWQVDYCAPGDEAVTECDHHWIVDIPREPNIKKALKAVKELRKILNEQQYDIIHCHTPMGGCVARLAARYLYKKHKVKIIYTAHGFHFYKGAPVKNWLVYYPIERYMLKYTDALITINKEDFEFSKQKFTKLTDVYFMNGVGVALSRFSKVTLEQNLELRKSLGYNQSDFLITVVAETNVNKNQSFLINQVPELLKYIPALKILFLGKETLPIARNLVEKKQLQNVCYFLGYRKDVDLFEKISDVCFSASIREGLPVNIIESLACGKVCICSHNRGHDSLIEHNINGLLFNLDNPAQMVEQIKSVYFDSELKNKLSQQAYESSKKYDVKEAVSFTENLYTKLLNGKE